MMSEEGSIDEGLLPEAEVYTLMRKMQDMNLPVSTEEIQVRFKISAPACASFKTSVAFSDRSVRLTNPRAFQDAAVPPCWPFKIELMRF